MDAKRKTGGMQQVFLLRADGFRLSGVAGARGAPVLGHGGFGGRKEFVLKEREIDASALMELW